MLTLYAFVSRKDFSALGGFFIVGLWVLIGTSVLNMFFQNATASLWIAGATVFVFGGNDARSTGQAAAYVLAQRLKAKGMAAFVEIPPNVDEDWNDVLLRRRWPTLIGHL